MVPRVVKSHQTINLKIFFFLNKLLFLAKSASQSVIFFLLSLTFSMHFSANGCLLPLCAVDGMAVTTVEGIGSTKTTIHPVQVEIT